MTLKDIETVRKALAKVANPRLWRTLVPTKQYPRKDAYQKTLWKIDKEKFAKMLRILSILIQSKVYLFWKKPKPVKAT